jgi:hypothetical protein
VTEVETRLKLVGYYRCAGHGFAMPLYGTAEGANNVFLARCSTTGDHQGTITGFDAVGVDDQRRLPPGESIDVEVGEPWRDVFLWNDAIFVGTPDQIWAELTSFHSDLEARAPLSLLDLALQARRPEAGRLAPVAMGFVVERFGSPQATGWRRQFLRQRIELGLRNALVGATLPDSEFRAVNLTELTDGLRLDLPTAIAGALRESVEGRKAIDAVAALAALLGATLMPRRDISSLEQQDALEGDPKPAPIVEPSSPREERSDVTPIVPEPVTKENGANELVTILPYGKRARAVTGHLRSGRNRDVRFDSDELEMLLLDHGLLDDGTDSPELLILVIDDDCLDGDRLPPQLERSLSGHIDNGSLVLVAPALPTNRPSVLLQASVRPFPPTGPLPAHAILDTAIARSPFWWGKAKRSFDRRISDVIQLAITAGRNPALRRELVQRNRGESLPVLSLGLLPETGGKGALIDGPGNLRLGSESSWVDGNPKRNDPDIFFSVRMSLDGGERDPHDDRLIAEGRRLTNRFPEFAARILTPIREANRRLFDNYSRHVEQLPSIPDELSNDLRAPQHAAAYTFDGEDRDGAMEVKIVVTAETPTLDLIENADRIGWSVVRYTDTASLRRFANEGPKGSFADEVDLGSLRSVEMHRRLATRGVDQRDVFRVGGDLVAEWVDTLPAAERAMARNEGRLRRSATRSFEDSGQDYLFKPEFVLSEHPAAKKLLALISATGRQLAKRRQMQRQADMHKCWTSPSLGFQRYAIVDGAVPAILVELQDHEVPVEDFFVIDGDLAVPALFRSRPFAIWARATLPAASSWMARFSLTNSFGGFPIVPPFRVNLDAHGRTALTLDDMSLPIADLALEVNRHIERVQSSQALSSWKEVHRAADDLPAMQRLNTLILDAYGLAAEADDIRILRRLLKLNARLE